MTSGYLREPNQGLSEVARQVHARAVEQWGSQRRTLLLGRHPAFEGALERVARFAQSDATVLITGETGTGKEIFALSVSELFGHRKGSFTGAVTDQRGVFAAADGGVLFLDEVGELPPPGQAILLRTLSDGEIVPVGDARAPRQCPRGGGDQPGPENAGRAGHVPRGPVLPLTVSVGGDSGDTRAGKRLAAPAGAFPGGAQSGAGAAQAVCGGDAGDAGRLRLAG